MVALDVRGSREIREWASVSLKVADCDMRLDTDRILEFSPTNASEWPLNLFCLFSDYGWPSVQDVGARCGLAVPEYMLTLDDAGLWSTTRRP